ncbi:RNA dependent RNA polymerase-domain-containing protein [Trametes elegans]|nr:RNA dependent RNA polymerase-domain-containing protein [Trametes elegans]
MGFKSSDMDPGTLSQLCGSGKNVVAAPEVKRYVERTTKSIANKADGEKPVPEADIDDVMDEFALAYAREQSVRLPWDELDREEKVLGAHPLGAIGCNHEELFRDSSDPDWYGGRVHFTARMQKDKKGVLHLYLDRPVLGSSNRFARRFGSRRFVRVRVHKDLMMKAEGDELREYFQRPFIIGGTIFRAFYAKEQNVFLFRTNEEIVKVGDTFTIKTPSCRSRDELSLEEFLRWHNDLHLNSEQTMVKWAARFALGLSNSIPGIRLHPDNVRFQDDIICDTFTGPGKPPSEMQMTDGCGFANRAVMRLLKAKFPTWQEEPTAIQCRIGGAKGLLLVRHDLSAKEEEQPTVWLRPSQLKIKYAPCALSERLLLPDADPALLTIDVLRASRMNTPVRLSIETITNLAENGVPHDCFRRLFEVNLKERINQLLRYERAEDMPLLWHAVAREGGVMMARMAREAAGTARAAGYVAEDYDAELEEEDEDGLDGLDKALNDQSTAWWEDPISGLPSSLEETCLTLLDSGFTPSTCPVLKAKLKEVAKRVVTTFQTRYKFQVPMSCSAFIVPDPFGVLGPNEVHVKCSRRALLDPEGRQTDIVLGDVLVTRHPCKVPSDVQKVKAVFSDKLRNYCDVIVISTRSHMYKGQSLNRHTASLTGGGDYDGDTMEVYWDPDIVGAFQEPDPRVYAVEPPEVQQCLVKNTQTVSAFLACVPPSAPMDYKIHAIQTYLLGALRGRSQVSTYSIWWEKSTYKLGYNHRETVFLAYMFCAVLDGLKTGVAVDPVAYNKHYTKWNRAGALSWKEELKSDSNERNYDSNPVIKVKRSQFQPLFIMDSLQAHVSYVCKEQLERIERNLNSSSRTSLDADLGRPWFDAMHRAEHLYKTGQTALRVELQKIKEHVEAQYAKASERRKVATVIHSSSSGMGDKGKARFTKLPIERRQDILREQSKEFHAGPMNLYCFDDPAAIKASYAYVYDHETTKEKWSRFPWDVATRSLCEIKAKALGRSKTLSDDFYRWMTITPAYLRHQTQKVNGPASRP